jgi:hypothetical protein
LPYPSFLDQAEYYELDAAAASPTPSPSLTYEAGEQARRRLPLYSRYDLRAGKIAASDRASSAARMSSMGLSKVREPVSAWTWCPSVLSARLAAGA